MTHAYLAGHTEDGVNEYFIENGFRRAGTIVEAEHYQRLAGSTPCRFLIDSNVHEGWLAGVPATPFDKYLDRLKRHVDTHGGWHAIEATVLDVIPGEPTRQPSYHERELAFEENMKRYQAMKAALGCLVLPVIRSGATTAELGQWAVLTGLWAQGTGTGNRARSAILAGDAGARVHGLGVESLAMATGCKWRSFDTRMWLTQATTGEGILVPVGGDQLAYLKAEEYHPARQKAGAHLLSLTKHEYDHIADKMHAVGFDVADMPKYPAERQKWNAYVVHCNAWRYNQVQTQQGLF